MSIKINSDGIVYGNCRLPQAMKVPTQTPKADRLWIPSRPETDPASPGRLMSWDELRAYDGALGGATLIGSTFLSSMPGGSLEPHPMALRIPDAIRERHLLVVGKSGAGKTGKLLLPMVAADLADPQKTVVVLDAKGDMTATVVELARRTRGEKAKILYLSFTEPDRSIGWNPIWKRDVKTLNEIAGCLAPPMPKNSTESPFWRIQGTRVVHALITFLQKKPEFCNLKYVRDLLSLDEYGTAKEFDRLGMPDSSAVSAILKDNITAQSIRYESQIFVEPFGDADVGAVTSTHELDFNVLAEPSVLILRFPEASVRLKELHGLFIRQLFAWIIATADSAPSHRLKNTISIYLDEFASAVGQIHDISRALNTFRSRNCWFTAAVQHLGQLEEVYGSSASVITESFGSIIAAPPVSGADSRFLAARTGEMKWTEYLASPEGDGKIVGHRTGVREVLTPIEIAMPPRHPQLGPLVTFLLADCKPLVGYLAPIWQYPGLEGWDHAMGGSLPQGSFPLRSQPLKCPDFGL